MIWEVDSVEYEEALQDYEEVFAQPSEAWREEWATEETFEALDHDGSRLSPEIQDTLSHLSMRPVATSRSVGQETDCEYWADPSGGLVIEVALKPDRIAGRHFVSSYFTDVTGFTVFPSDANVCAVETPPRRNVRGVDDLREDVQTGMRLMAEKRAEGVRTLATVDVLTAELRQEFYAVFLVPDPYRVAVESYNPADTSDWIAEFNRQLLMKFGLGTAGLIVVVLAICFAFGMKPLRLLLLGIFLVVMAAAMIRSGVTNFRNQSKSEVSEFSKEEIMEMAKKIEKGMKDSEGS